MKNFMADIAGNTGNHRWPLLVGLAFVAHCAVAWGVLFSSRMAFGSDGYYYAAQVRYFLTHGRFFSPDSSPVLYLMVGASHLWNDIVVTNKLVVILLSSIMVFPLFLTGKKLRGEPAGIILILLYAFNSMVSEFSIEYVKNLGGIVAFAFLLWRAAIIYRDGIGIRNAAYLAVFLVITFFAHKLMAVIALLFCLLFFLPGVFKRRTVILGIVLLAVVLPLLTLLFPNLINLSDFSRISSSFSRAPNFAPYSYFKISGSAWWQVPEIALFFVSPVFLVIAHLKARSDLAGFSLYLLPVYLAAVFPFLEFTSADMAYRLFIMLFIPAAFSIASLVPEIKTRLLVLLLLLFSLYHYSSMTRFRDTMQFDYRLYSMILPLIDIPGNSLLIVHQGFDYFYCYSGRGDALHFLPEPKHRGRPVYRLAYGVTMEEAHRHLSPGKVTVLPGYYTLMKEEDWNTLLSRIDPGRKKQLLTWRNPHIFRPDYMKRNDRFIRD
jgi:hypothetical protein